MSIVKEIKFESDARDALKEGVITLARAVKSTLGPQGSTVLMDSEVHTMGITSTKDGVTVAKSINLQDPYQDLAVRTVREAAQETAKLAGDGTTTSIVLAEAIIVKALELNREEYNTVELTRAMDAICDSIVEMLEENSIKLSDRGTLLNVATVSANNDRELGEIIGDLYDKVGKDGAVIAEDSFDVSGSTYSELIEGLRFNRGWVSPVQLTNERTQTIEFKDPFIMVTDREIQSLHDIAHILEQATGTGKPLLIIGNMSMEAQQTLNANVRKGRKWANILPPGFGSDLKRQMDDIATATGATYISEDQDGMWSTMNITNLGRAEKISIDKKTTSIIVANSEALNERVEVLRAQLADTKQDDEQKQLEERIANLCGKVGVIYVGGRTDVEQKERRDRVDDAILATRAALDDGILPGGGVALSKCLNFKIPNESVESMKAAEIITEAIQEPITQILVNAHKDVETIKGKVNDSNDKNFGYNARTNEFGDMLKMGIIDPAKVTKTALRNAVSVATTMIECNTAIINKRQL